MGLFGKLFGEFVDVIEWTDDSAPAGGAQAVGRTMVHRFERYGNEIKYGAKLIVRESQLAVFVNEGQVADVLGPGTYELETKNLPVLTTLQHWQTGFRSPFKAEVYFCSARRFTDLKWGTKQPLMLRDPEFGGLRVRAFGTYGTRIVDALRFVREIVGTEGVFTTDEISDQLRNIITSRFASIVGGADIPVLDMAANYDQLGELLTRRIAPEFAEYGLELTRVLVENISLPAKVSEALDERTSRGLTGNLDEYLKYQTGVAMKAAAENPGGGASAGVGMGVGIGMGQAMAQGMAQSAAASAARGTAAGTAQGTAASAVEGTAASAAGGTTRSAAGGTGDGGTGERVAGDVASAATTGTTATAGKGFAGGGDTGATGGGSSGHAPPPLPSASAKYHVETDGRIDGPYGLDELADRVARGTLEPATLVWAEGMQAWTPAADVPPVAALFAESRGAGAPGDEGAPGNRPPPLPPR